MRQNAGEVIAAISDSTTGRLLKDAFGNRPWQSSFYGSSGEVFQEIEKPKENQGPCIILLVGAPVDMGIAEFYKELRKRSVTVPFIMVSADSEIPGLKISKRDIFTVPFRLGALLDRIGTHMNRECITWVDVTIDIGPWKFSPEDSVLLRKDQKDMDSTILLTEKERDILMNLYYQKGKSVDRDALLNDLWGYVNGVETHTLETHIYRLRKKIEKDPADPKFLVTDRTGYRLET